MNTETKSIIENYKDAYIKANNEEVIISNYNETYHTVLVKGRLSSNSFEYKISDLVEMTNRLRDRVLVREKHKTELSNRLHDLRGKLTPITNLISIMELDQIMNSITDDKIKTILLKSILASKEVINELAELEVYKLKDEQDNDNRQV